jgi:DNA uptake protein ComE-like DNA-binding protein
MENSWKAYFIFSKKEQRGILVLGCMLLASMAIGFLFPAKKSLQKTHSTIKQALFYFDPNTIDSITALRLGIPIRQVTTLLRYRNKGGRFYQKEDIAKLYGLKKELVAQLIPYVAIKNFEKNIDRNTNKNIANQKTFSNAYNRIVNRRELLNDKSNKNLHEWSIDINLADEKQWAVNTKLNPTIIQNIIRYRNYLGGFSNKNQLKKVYGLTEDEFYALKAHLTIGAIKMMKPNANTMRFEQWKLLGLFTEKEIAIILHTRKENGGHIGWKELVILFDLTAQQAAMLQNSIQISE